MGWRTIYITQKAKLSYKANHLLIQTNMDIKQIPFHQINCIIIATTQSVITGYLISKLVSENIKVVFCAEDHNPCAELNGYYNNIQRNQNIENQVSWSLPKKQDLWTQIVKNKLQNQRSVLVRAKLSPSFLDNEYSFIQENDSSNREAVIARKYFLALFNEDFSRGKDTKINAMLNYGYTILLSATNQEVIAQGYLTQLGIHHHSLKNCFNLSSDLMEPFRPFIDDKVFQKSDYNFDEYMKLELVDILNQEISYGSKTFILKNALSQYIRDCISYLDPNQEVEIKKVGFKDEE